MDAWIHHLTTLLALPEYSLGTVFVVSFVSATLLPLGSEPVVFGLIQLNPALWWQVIAVATLGNTLGGAVDWWMGYGAERAYERLAHPPSHGPAVRWLARFRYDNLAKVAELGVPFERIERDSDAGQTRQQADADELDQVAVARALVAGVQRHLDVAGRDRAAGARLAGAVGQAAQVDQEDVVVVGHGVALGDALNQDLVAGDAGAKAASCRLVVGVALVPRLDSGLHGADHRFRQADRGQLAFNHTFRLAGEVVEHRIPFVAGHRDAAGQRFKAHGQGADAVHRDRELDDAAPEAGRLDGPGERAVVGEGRGADQRGQKGEIVVRGAHVATRYLDDPERTARTFLPDGGMRTGDQGALDAIEAFHAGTMSEQTALSICRSAKSANVMRAQMRWRR